MGSPMARCPANARRVTRRRCFSRGASSVRPGKAITCRDGGMLRPCPGRRGQRLACCRPNRLCQPRRPRCRQRWLIAPRDTVHCRLGGLCCTLARTRGRHRAAQRARKCASPSLDGRKRVESATVEAAGSSTRRCGCVSGGLLSPPKVTGLCRARAGQNGT